MAMSLAARPAAPPSPLAAATTGPPALGDDDAIEPDDTGEIETDEFEATDFDTLTSTSTSITSSVYQHSFENGRRYHRYRHGRYPIPNDDEEQNREATKHAMHLELTDGKLFFAPIGDNPQKIIDLGTGTGAWAIDVADQYPSAEVIGIDLSPIQSSWVPPNLRFVVDDFEDEWMSGDNFDLVHIRSAAILVRDVPKLLERSFRHLKPGGWVEIQELGGQILSDDDSLGDSRLPKFFDKMGEAFAVLGMKYFYIANELGPYLESAGFVNISSKTIKVPVGTWAKDKTLRLCGMYLKMSVSGFMSAVVAKPLLALGMTKVEAEVFAALARKDMDNPTAHAYMNYRFWMAQKPTSKTEE